MSAKLLKGGDIRNSIRGSIIGVTKGNTRSLVPKP